MIAINPPGRHSGNRPKTSTAKKAIVAGTIAAVAAAALAVPVFSAGATTTVSTAVTDNFDRSVVSGWGTVPAIRWASTPPTLSTSSSAAFSVDGQRGLIAAEPTQEHRAALAGVTALDVNMKVDNAFAAMPTGSGIYASFTARQNQLNEYRGTLRVGPQGKVSALIYRIAGPEAIIGQEVIIPGLTYTPGDVLSSRFQVTGSNPSTLKMTIWPAAGAEPAPQLSSTDSTAALQNAGGEGLLLRLSSGSTAKTLMTGYDNFSTTELISVIPATSSSISSAVPTSSAPVTATTAQTTAPTTAPPVDVSGCVGTNVRSGANLVAVVAAAPAGQTICIAPGNYRLGAPLVPKAGVTLWGATGATLDGAVPLSNFSAGSGGWYVNGVLPASYSGPGQCEDNVNNPCLKAEQVFSDDARLTRVMSKASLTAGTFYEDYSANQVWVGSNPSGHSLAMDSTRLAIQSFNSNVTVRGLTIQHFASLGQQGALFAGGSGWKILDNTVVNNHAVGIYLSHSDSSVVSGNLVSGNGQLGISQYTSQSVVVSHNTINGNNTEGFWIADWEAGGYKATWSSVSFSGNTVSGNAGVGVWFDCDAKGAVIENNTISNNASDGIRYEISYDGTIRNNVISGNGFGMKRGGGTSIFASDGINSHDSSNMEIYGNQVINNLNGIGLQERNRGSGKYGVWELANNHVYNNTVTMTVGVAWGHGASGIGQLGGTNYLTGHGNSFTGNKYILDSLSARRFSWNGTYLTIAQWQAAGNDVGVAASIAAAK